MKIVSCSLLLAFGAWLTSTAQNFDFGPVSLNDLKMTRYDKDTAASAVVLKEFGQARIMNSDDFELLFKYHVRIKILNKNGLSQSTIEIPLYHQNSNRFEKIVALKASSFNIENGRIKEEVLQTKDIFEEKRNKYVTYKKFAIPSVRVGSVIELEYSLQSPFIFNFREWAFQSDIPKMESEYWAAIPGVYLYNITLRGYLKLTKNESAVKKDCLGAVSSPLSNAFSADCLLMQFGMKDIPAFVEEEYMTAKKNFISSIHFELSEIRYPDGRVDRVTKEWQDAELELKQDARFGVQLKRGKDIGSEVERLVEGKTDELEKAKDVYDFIRNWYMWNGTYGKYSEYGIKKAFDEHKGNVGDINLSLVAALRFADLDAEPVILSTRDNGMVVELHPVLSEFNYVIAKVNIGNDVHFADATDKLHPFGMLPERCLNGKGRVVGDGKSYWVDLKPGGIGKSVSMFTLKLENDGRVKGSLSTTFMGYHAVTKRREIFSYPAREDYIRELQKALGEVEIMDWGMKDVEDIDKPLTRTLDIEFTIFDNPEVTNFLLNPFLLDRMPENPFKSTERLYPVDFGTPMERVTIFNLEYPAQFEIVNLPERLGLSLPDSGGRFIFEARNTGNKLSIHNSLAIRKTVFTSTEYHYLKELFNRILQVQKADLIFKKRT